MLILADFSIAYITLAVKGEKEMSEELLRVEEAAKILKVRRETIRRYIKNGHLQALTLPGGDYRLRERDIQKLLSCPGQKKGSQNAE